MACGFLGCISMNKPPESGYKLKRHGTKKLEMKRSEVELSEEDNIKYCETKTIKTYKRK